MRGELNLFDAVSIIVGIMIGSGIFFTPTFVLQRAGAPGLALLVWLAAGVVSVLSGLCYAELGAARPQAGGVYVYLREAFGPLVAFTSTYLRLLLNTLLEDPKSSLVGLVVPVVGSSLLLLQAEEQGH